MSMCVCVLNATAFPCTRSSSFPKILHCTLRAATACYNRTSRHRHPLLFPHPLLCVGDVRHNSVFLHFLLLRQFSFMNISFLFIRRVVRLHPIHPSIRSSCHPSIDFFYFHIVFHYVSFNFNFPFLLHLL